jgi:hypothetical protein
MLVHVYVVPPALQGLQALKNVPRYDKEAVHHLAFSPNRNIMQVEWDGKDYWLVAVKPGALSTHCIQPSG